MNVKLYFLVEMFNHKFKLYYYYKYLSRNEKLCVQLNIQVKNSIPPLK